MKKSTSRSRRASSAEPRGSWSRPNTEGQREREERPKEGEGLLRASTQGRFCVMLVGSHVLLSPPNCHPLPPHPTPFLSHPCQACPVPRGCVLFVPHGGRAHGGKHGTELYAKRLMTCLRHVWMLHESRDTETSNCAALLSMFS